MPVISRFYGIAIKMFFRTSEHNPPHIHAIYGEEAALIDIKTLEMMEGDLSKRALKLVQEWIAINQDELLEMWNSENIHSIRPLV